MRGYDGASTEYARISSCTHSHVKKREFRTTGCGDQSSFSGIIQVKPGWLVGMKFQQRQLLCARVMHFSAFHYYSNFQPFCLRLVGYKYYNKILLTLGAHA